LSRYAKGDRWTGILQERLGADHHIIEEGLPGRTTVWSDPLEGYKSGKEYLIPCLESHAPLDMCIIMLGTNDLKKRFSVTPFDIGTGVLTLVKMAEASWSQSPLYSGRELPKMLVIIPPPIKEIGFLAEMFEGGEQKSARLAETYRRIEQISSAHILDAAQYIVVSELDGIHFDRQDHRILGNVVADKVNEMFVE
jgi:lysophospholipase L1-like esterase